MLLPDEDDLIAERKAVERSIESSDHEFRRAVVALKAAVRGKIGFVHRLAEHVATKPAPWLFAASLLGVWIGARDRDASGRKEGIDD